MPTFSPERSALRGIGSSAVVVSHMLGWFSVYLVFSPTESWITSDVRDIGWMGVAMFLSLSIYLLMGSLDANPSLAHYFTRRVKRIWPLYMATCVAVFALLDPNWTTLVWNLSFLAVFSPSHAFHLAGNTIYTNYVVWTLQVEEWAYLCFPLIARLGHRPRIAVAAGLLGAAVGVMVWSPVPLGSLYITPWPWLACYGFGLLAYEARGNWRSAGRWSALGLMAGFLIPWPFGLLAVGPFVAWVIVYPPTFLKNLALVAIGECSYALYLTHIIFLDLLGPFGIAIAYPFSWLVESTQRGREMRRRVRGIRPHNPPG